MENQKYDVVKEKKKLTIVRVVGIVVGGICFLMTLSLLAAIFIPYDENDELERVKTELSETKRALVRQEVATELAETKKEDTAEEELSAFAIHIHDIGIYIGTTLTTWLFEEGSEESSRYCREDAIPAIRANRREWMKHSPTESFFKAENKILRIQQDKLDDLDIDCDLYVIK